MSYLICFFVIATVLLIWGLFRLTIIEDKVDKLEERMEKAEERLITLFEMSDFYDESLDSIHIELKYIKEHLFS